MKSKEITDRLRNFDMVISEGKKVFNRQNYKDIFPEYSQLSKSTFDRAIRELKQILNDKYGSLAIEHNDELLRIDPITDSYYYVSKGIRAFDDITQNDAEALLNNLLKLKNLLPENEEIIQKIQAKVIGKIAQDNNVIHWEPLSLIFNGNRYGDHFLDNLLNALTTKSPLEIIYSNYKTNKYLALPVYLKEIHNGWYASWYLLVAELTANRLEVTYVETKKLRVLALEKINSTSHYKTDQTIIIKNNFNPADYFKHTLGIWSNNLKGGIPHIPDLIDISFVIKPNSWILQYVIDHPVHFSQELNVNDKGETIGTLRLEPTFDVTDYFYRYADQIKVISPQSLIINISKKIANSLSNYQFNL